MLDPTMANYVDILVNQMIKKPEAVLERLVPARPLTDIPTVALSKFLYCNGQALPLPRLSEQERKDIRKDIDKAVERLTRWENASNVVPQLNLRDIKKKHRDRKKSQESVPKSPEVYVTARDEVEQKSDHVVVETSPRGAVSGDVLGRVDQEELQIPGVASKIPVCQYSSSPMVSKAYKPLSAESSKNTLITRNTTSTTTIPGDNPPAADDVTEKVPDLTNEGASPTSSLQDNTPLILGPPGNSRAPSDLSSSREELELYNSRRVVLDPESSSGELELSNSQNLVLSDSREDAETAEEVVVVDSSSALASSMLRTSEKSPPSSQVLRHLEALEAVIELDMTMQSTAGLQSTQHCTPAQQSTQQPTPASAAKRRLDLNSPPSTSPSETKRPFSLNLTGKVGSRKLPEEPSTPSSPTPSSPATPRRGISFYVEVDSPHSPRSPRPSLARRNTIASPRSASPGSSSDLHRMADKISSPRSGRRNSGVTGRVRSSSSLVSSTSHTTKSEPPPPPSQPPPPPQPEGAGSSLLGPDQEVLTPRRVRTDSYNTDCSMVIDARASKITALIRGYLTRALLNSYKAQQYVKTIRDTEEILSGYQDISGMSEQDRAFYDRLKETLQQTKERLHAIFFSTSVTDQMTLIANTRSARRELHHKQGKLVKPGSARKRMVKKTVRQKAWI